MTVTSSHATRDAILDAADRLLVRYGFRKTTMEDIAKEAGLSRRTIYLHFSGKDEVGLSSIDRVVERTHSVLRAIALSPASAPERLHSILVTRVTHRASQVQEYRTSLDELFEAVRPAYLERRKGHQQEEIDLIAGVISEGVRASLFKCDEADATAAVLVHATNAYLPYSLSTAELNDLGLIEESARRLASLLLRGLMADGSSLWDAFPRD